jgi:hypothetical protein
MALAGAPTMNIDRPMVTLFFEIKRNLPFEARDDLKISSPVIGTQLVSIYQTSSDKPLRRLIEEFMQRAGDTWVSKLSKPQKSKPKQARESIVNLIRLTQRA